MGNCLIVDVEIIDRTTGRVDTYRTTLTKNGLNTNKIDVPVLPRTLEYIQRTILDVNREQHERALAQL